MKQMQVTTYQIKTARQANLFAYLLTNHSDDIIVDKHGKTLRLTDNHSLSVKDGYSGYLDFATGETGNGIDLLTRHFGYTFADAVVALTNDSGEAIYIPTLKTTEMKRKKDCLQLPPTSPDYKRVMAYLIKSRKLPPELVQSLIDRRLLYQAATTYNAVFVSAQRDFAELRGTLTDKPYHGIVAGSRHDGCWFFRQGDQPTTAYICESAIDAISLCVLLNEKAYYISIAGAAKQAAIDRVKKSKLNIIIATDNDKAGDDCRSRNLDCKTIRPTSKDWNDDLINQN